MDEAPNKAAWECPEFHWRDVPAVVQHMLNVTVSAMTVNRWIHKGLKRSTDPKQRVYLKTVSRIGRVFVTRADLEAFLKAT